jgi:hypothetical protein
VARIVELLLAEVISMRSRKTTFGALAGIVVVAVIPFVMTISPRSSIAQIPPAPTPGPTPSPLPTPKPVPSPSPTPSPAPSPNPLPTNNPNPNPYPH